MATRKEEKERLRAARLEAERREALAARKRLILGYGVAGVLTAAVLVGIVIVIASGGGGSGEDTPEAAHIDTATGSLNGVAPDAREGTTPPAVENLDLENAAADAGCDLRLGLPDEGSTHLEPDAKTPELPHQPADLGQPRHHPVPAGRRRLRGDARADRVRPLARARPDRDPVRARPAGGGPARPQGGLRREPVRDAAVPEPRHALRGRGHRLDAAPGVQAATRERRRWTRSATSATSSAAAAPRAVPFTPVGRCGSLACRRLSSSLLARRSRSVVAIADQSTISTGNRYSGQKYQWAMCARGRSIRRL